VASHNVNTSLKLYATSRGGENLGIKVGSKAQVVYPKLDIGKQKSIQELAAMIKGDDKHVNILINNAGLHLDQQYNAENAKTTLDVNYRGTLAMCQVFIPLLSKNGRIVNLSSVGSSLNRYSEDIRQRFRDSDMTLEGLEQLAREYEQAVRDKTEVQRGFGGTGGSYCFSKACLNGFTATLAREHPGLIINCCCPGWVDTVMGSILGNPPKHPLDGAKIPVRLGFGDIGDATGRYWANDSISSTDDGKIQIW